MNSPIINDASEANTKAGSVLADYFRMPVSWVLLIVLDVCLVTLSSAQEQPQSPDTGVYQEQVFEIEAPATADDGIRFEALDLFVDSGQHSMAAWQLEIQSTSNQVEIVGIEGGEHSAFADPAYYDPNAMKGNRVILAAFSTDEQLPSGKTRIARIHVQCEGRNVIPYTARLIVASDLEGKSIAGHLSVARAISETEREE